MIICDVGLITKQQGGKLMSDFSSFSLTSFPMEQCGALLPCSVGMIKSD